MQTTPQDIGAALLRLAMGVMFLAHGLLKVLVFTLPGTVGFFESIGLPGFLAYVVTIAEIGGGALLILGYKTRMVAWALTPVLLGATWAHLGNGWLFTNANGGWEYPVFLVVAGIAVALLGPGAWAIDKRG
jgi:putative oxidoreductase